MTRAMIPHLKVPDWEFEHSGSTANGNDAERRTGTTSGRQGGSISQGNQRLPSMETAPPLDEMARPPSPGRVTKTGFKRVLERINVKCGVPRTEIRSKKPVFQRDTSVRHALGRKKTRRRNGWLTDDLLEP